MKTSFDECAEAQPLRDQLWMNRGEVEFWRLLQECDSRVRLQPAATKQPIAQLRRYAGGTLPDTLEEFLRHSNGLFFDADAIVFPTDRIIRETEKMRQEEGCMPIDHLLFIGALGDGDMFAFGKAKSGEWLRDVFWWEHETDSRYSCGFLIWGYVAAHVSWRHPMKHGPAV